MQKIPFKTFALATAHRAENVDDVAVLESFMEVFSKSPSADCLPNASTNKKATARKQHASANGKNKEHSDSSAAGILGFLGFDEKLQVNHH